MKAIEAREKTDKILNKSSLKYEEILKGIEDAIEKGEYYYHINTKEFILSEELTLKMKNLGYSVRGFDDNLFIRW